MFITLETKKYHRLLMQLLSNLSSFDRDLSKQRDRLKPIIDFDDWCLSKAYSLGIKEYYLEMTNGGETSVIMFQPHNFPNVNYLNLAESYFIRLKDRRDERLSLVCPCRYVEELYSEFRGTCARQIVTELMKRITEIPGTISAIMKNFLKFARVSGCIRTDEVTLITKVCLNAMYRQEQMFGSDRNLTVQILKTLCVLQQHKETLVIGDYSYDLIDYVLTCCNEAKFDIERYFFYDDSGKRTYFCPVTASIISSRHDFRKLRTLLEHGFELQALNLSLMKFIYVFVGMTDRLRANGVGIADSELRISDRRQYILLLFLFMVFNCFTLTQRSWVDCSKLLFNSIPDAYICEFEVCCFLRMPYLNENYESIHNLCKEFEGSYAVSRSPRTLKHLSRCVVRKLLRNNFQLPNGIISLNLPRTLESYLKYLED